MTFTPADGGKRFRIKEDGAEGRLEGWPLADPGPYATEGGGILWIPESGERAQYFQHVTRAEVEECAEQYPFVEVED